MSKFSAEDLKFNTELPWEILGRPHGELIKMFAPKIIGLAGAYFVSINSINTRGRQALT